MTTFNTNNTARFGVRALVAALASGLLAGLAQAGTLEVLVLDRDNKPVPDAQYTRHTQKGAAPERHR